MKAKKKRRGGFLGAVEHVASVPVHATEHGLSQAYDELTGIGPGVVDTGKAAVHDIVHDPLGNAQVGGPLGYAVTHRKKSHLYKEAVKPTVDSYKWQYGPLAHGDFGTFVHRLYEQPLGPLMDAGALFTGGLTEAGRVGRALSAAGKISPESKLARLGAPGEIVLRSPRAMAGDLSPNIRKPTHLNAGVKVRQQAADKAMKKIDQHLLKHHLDRFPNGAPYIGEIARYSREFDRLPRQKAARLQLAQKQYADITRGMRPAEWEAFHIIGKGQTIESLRKVWAGNPEALKVLDNPKIQKMVANPTKRMEKAYLAGKALTETDARVKELDPHLAENRKYLSYRAELGDTELKMPLDQVKAEFAKTGRREPIYVPDRYAPEHVANEGLARQGGGGGPVRPLTSMKENKNILFSAGQVSLNHDLIGPTFAATVKHNLFDDIHSHLTDAAVRWPKGRPLPPGFRFIRRNASEKIHALERQSGDHVAARNQLIDDAAAREKVDVFSSKYEDDAMSLHGDRLIIPEHLAKHVAGEFTRSHAALRWLSKPTKVWRTLVLGLRPGYLVNNVVGNTFLYFLHHPDVHGMRALLWAVKREEGDGAVRQLLNEGGLDAQTKTQFMEEFFPQHTANAGTFAGTSDLSTGTGRVTHQLAKITTAIPRLDKAYEGRLRAAAVRAALEKSPEFKATMKRMKGETRKFTAVGRQSLKDNPQLERRVSDDVDAALGNFRDLGPLGQTLRAWAPFYAWYRAITVITFKLALNNPVRARVLAQLGEIGTQDTEKVLGEIEAFLHGAIPVGERHGAMQHVLPTQGFNPFSTVGQEAAALPALLPGGGSVESKKALLGFVSPFVTGGATDITNGKAGKYGAVGDPLVAVASSLPQWKLIQALTQDPYTGRYDHNKLTAILSYLGVPLKNLNVPYENAKAFQASQNG